MTLVQDDSTVTGQAASSAEARAAISALLAGRALPPGSRAHGDSLLVVSELVANVLRHTGGPATLAAYLHGATLDVTVSEGCTSGPDQDPPDRGQDATARFGWLVVSRLASMVAVTRPRPGGKRIRVHMAV
ncbi:ATP-binding protein [Streptomyces tropicalis]|uniref:ATP-binding protein n=1 Tax=Streptomyces tropicalis TaxID=3034234 RepID=A0ABT6AAB3_9ACTN|nr:ATP-binding protein [Streptomyces tropicalis]MDF3301398.1 ATP-binding protein [Streptomyces tropicalis]